MISKQTVLDQIEVTRNGILQIRIALELVEDGKVISSKWHRTSIPPDVSVDEQMAAVKEHLAQMAEQPLSAADIAKIKAHHNL